MKINGEKLLEIQDDGGFLKYVLPLLPTDLSSLRSLMRGYFVSLGESAHPKSSDSRARAITRFQELLLISFREFSIITDETIQSERKRYRSEIITSIESFSKRSSIRNLKSLGRFNKDQVGLIYDALYKAMCVVPPPPSLTKSADGTEDEGRIETRIGPATFKVFLSEVVTWARNDKIVRNGFGSIGGIDVGLSRERLDREVADHEFLDRLFYFWDVEGRGALSFQVGE